MIRSSTPARRLIIATWLALLAAGPTVPTADAQTTDQLTPYQSGHGWFTRDKAYHFTLSAVGSAAAYAAGRELGLGRWPAVALSVVITGTAGFLRETFSSDDPNLLTRSHFSRRDMLWNGAGIVVGISLTELLAHHRWRDP